MPGNTLHGSPAFRSAPRPFSRGRLLPLLLLLLCLGGTRPAWAQSGAPPPSPPGKDLDVAATVISYGPGRPDLISIAYDSQTKNAEIQQDFATLAQELGSAPPKVRITRDQQLKIPQGEAEVAGLTNWSTGAINLDPLIRVLRRFGHFRAGFLFAGGKYPLQQIPQGVNQGPLRVDVLNSTDQSVSYEVWINQSGGVPASLPSTNGETGLGWRLWVGIAAIAAVIAVSVFLIVNIILGQRRAAEAREGK